MRRLLWVGLGLLLAGAGLFVLARGGSGGWSAAGGRPLDEIDAASRRQLERVLEHAERRDREAAR